MDNPCLRCDARCCRRYAIYVLPHEVARLASALGRPRASLAAAETADLAPELPVVYLEGQPAQLALARSPEGACTLLDTTTDRCTAHGIAPYICRMYPHTATGDEGPRIRQLNEVLCPEPFPLPPEREQELVALSMPFWNEQVNEYRRRAQQWNLRLDGGGLDAFLAFCLDGE